MAKKSLQGPFSRRHMIKALFGGALVVGFHAATGTWVTAAQAAELPQFEKLPPLDGVLYRDEATRTEYGQDFGQIVFERPLAVLKPGSARDISLIIQFARRNRIRIVGRGKSHTVFGQSQVKAGVSIDMSALATISAIGHDRIIVDAGIRWHDLLKATLEQGLMPPVLPDYIGQTVGGTLSVGGIGGMTYRHGAQVDHVLELSVITGEGQQVQCSATRNRDLFEAALAGQGQVAVIAQAVLRLVPAPSNVRLYDLFYADLPTLIGDLNRVMDDERFDQIEGWALPQPDGTWAYLLEAIAFHRADGPPNDLALLDGLRHLPEATQKADMSFWEWSTRVPLNLPKQPHPWIDLIVPGSAITAFVGDVQATIKPLAPADSFSILLIPAKPARFTRPLFRAPSEEHAFGFGILRFSPYDSNVIGQILDYNRKLFDKNRDLGGTHYPISAVRLAAKDWRRHYGPYWDELLAAKRRYDPDNVLASGPDVLGQAAVGGRSTAEQTE
jgi:FAD/FMN-containing dehydrogenase